MATKEFYRVKDLVIEAQYKQSIGNEFWAITCIYHGCRIGP